MEGKSRITITAEEREAIIASAKRFGVRGGQMTTGTDGPCCLVGHVGLAKGLTHESPEHEFYGLVDDVWLDAHVGNVWTPSVTDFSDMWWDSYVVEAENFDLDRWVDEVLDVACEVVA